MINPSKPNKDILKTTFLPIMSYLYLDYSDNKHKQTSKMMCDYGKIMLFILKTSD